MSDTYGYVVVSPHYRNEKKQIADMEKFGVLKSRIVTENQPGYENGRPVYDRLIRKMRRGDTLVIDGLRSLGGNYIEIVEQWRTVTKERGLNIAVLEMPLIDTRTKAGDINSGFITELVLQILTHIASEAEYGYEYKERDQTEVTGAVKERGNQEQTTRKVGVKQYGLKIFRPNIIITRYEKEPKKSRPKSRRKPLEVRSGKIN